jgi:hypothetical protein
MHAKSWWGKVSYKHPLERLRRIWDVNIMEIGCVDVRRMQLTQDLVQW